MDLLFGSIDGGPFAVLFALGRSVSLIAQDALVLRAIGMTRHDLVRAAVGAHLVTVAVAVAAAAAVAIGASRFFPVGLGRRVDVDVGTHADWTVLAGGLAITAAGIVAGVVLTAGRSSRLTAAGGAHRPSALVAAVRRRAPVAVGLGTSMACERGHGRASVALRPALLGAVIGVLGVVATLTIDHGIDDSLAHPERAGVTWDATATVDLSAYAPDGLRPEVIDEVLAGAPVGSSAAVVDRQVLDIDGVGAPTFAFRESRGEAPIALAVTEGRAPTAVGEAAIGPETARVLGVGVGDTASFSGREVDVVGFALFPSSVHSGFDEGVWVTPEQLELVSPSPELADDYGGSRSLALRFPAGADVGAEVGRMAETLGPTVTEISPVEVPVELENLRNVRALPVFLAGFLALLAVAAVGHVLVSSSRRRRHDFAVMRAVGFTRRGARLTLSAQGTAIGLVGLAMGVPLGVAGGRAGWSWIAARVPLDDVAPVALIAVLLIVPVTVAIVNALAVWPGRAAARIRPSDVLRSE
ncbi:MAG: ABC transporter permease [Acidimicrobiia bacterium]|nr:ABC transporter permease [Acidimicrobiia bacterium]